VKLWKTEDKLKFKPNLTSKLSLSKSLPKENPSPPPDKTLKDNWPTTNKPSTSKRRERKTPLKNSTPPHQEKNKKKLNVIHGELNMLKTLNTDKPKSQSSDKLKRSSPPNYPTLKFISKKDLLHDLLNQY